MRADSKWSTSDEAAGVEAQAATSPAASAAASSAPITAVDYTNWASGEPNDWNGSTSGGANCDQATDGRYWR